MSNGPVAGPYTRDQAQLLGIPATWTAHNCDTRHPCPHRDEPAQIVRAASGTPAPAGTAAEPPQTGSAGATTVSDAAVEAFLRARQAGYGPNLDHAIAAARAGTLWEAARGWLEAAAPHIAAQAIHDAAAILGHERLYVILERAPHAPGKFKQILLARTPETDRDIALDIAADQERMALEGGRYDDRYIACELRPIEGGLGSGKPTRTQAAEAILRTPS